MVSFTNHLAFGQEVQEPEDKHTGLKRPIGYFLLISDFLTRNGYAVLRYDKRGVGESANPNRRYILNAAINQG